MRRTLCLFSLTALCFMASASVQDPITLRYDLKEGQVDKYSVKVQVVQNVEVPQMGAMDMNIDMAYNYAVMLGKVDSNGKADVQLKTSDLTMKMSGSLAEMMGGGGQPPKDAVQTGKIDNRYRVSDLKMANMSPEMMMAMGSSSTMSLFLELPEGAVKSGDAFTISLPANPMMGTKTPTKLAAKFVGEATVDGISGYKLEMAGTVPMNLDMAAMMEEMAKQNPNADPSGGMMGGMKMYVKGTIDMKQTAIVDKATSRMLWTSMEISTKATTEMPDMNMSIPTTGTVKTIAKLIR